MAAYGPRAVVCPCQGYNQDKLQFAAGPREKTNAGIQTEPGEEPRRSRDNMQTAHRKLASSLSWKHSVSPEMTFNMSAHLQFNKVYFIQVTFLSMSGSTRVQSVFLFQWRGFHVWIKKTQFSGMEVLLWHIFCYNTDVSFSWRQNTSCRFWRRRPPAPDRAPGWRHRGLDIGCDARTLRRLLTAWWRWILRCANDPSCRFIQEHLPFRIGWDSDLRTWPLRKKRKHQQWDVDPRESHGVLCGDAREIFPCSVKLAPITRWIMTSF